MSSSTGGSARSAREAAQHTSQHAAQQARVTLADVARAANCSIAVASKALSGRPHVAPATRTRVLEAARTLGFRKRPSRPPGRRNAISAIAASSTGELAAYSSELLAGALSAADKAGVEVVTALVGHGLTRSWFDRHLASGTQGAFVITSTMEAPALAAARAARFPIVMIDPRSQISDDVVTVGATNWAGATAGTQHLIDLGHTRLAFAGVGTGSDFALERYGGFRSTLERSGLPLVPEYCFTGDTNYDSGLAIGEQIATMDPRPTGVMCICDTAAVGVIEGARRAGLRTPEDLSVVGFDDLEFAKWTSPPLTTVRQPLRRMGRLAVRTLLQLVHGREPDSHHVQLATSLHVRGSTGPPSR